MSTSESTPQPRGDFLVGEAKQVLEQSRGVLRDHASEIRAMGVGLRDNERAFIVTVPDLDARDRFLKGYKSEKVGALPLRVDVSSFCETGLVLEGRRFDASHLVPRLSLAKRISRFFHGLGALFAP